MAPSSSGTSSREGPLVGEVRVRITAAGLCHTDLSARAAWPAQLSPMVFGHEETGTVEAVGAGVTSVAPSDTGLPHMQQPRRPR
ncbi:alcohol dehydrogenase catalytic domain-containing protein [Streptomyces sp. NPDC005435]|uniref:alcohol dehydrogenase catalytic domain-containing protein n=1 Tax=Streptomyces sp. NPDC005435 TaxID=3154464 RepID=UPI003455F237